MLPVIQSLWIGDDLTNLEKLCIRSFIDHGHEFHLYTYGDIGGIPDGAVVKDGNEILPERNIFYCRDGRIGPFSDWFRYTLLAEKGGFWVDMDYVCLQPFDFPADIVFCPDDDVGFNTAVTKFPARHECMVSLAAACAKTKNKEKLRYAAFYRLLTPEIRRVGLEHYAMPISTFFPLETDPVSLIFESTGCPPPPPPPPPPPTFGKHTYGMHIAGGKLLRLPGFSKNANFPPDSVFEQLKRKHGIPPVTDAPTYTHDEISTLFVRHRADGITRKEAKKSRLKIIVGVLAAALLVVGFSIGVMV